MKKGKFLTDVHKNIENKSFTVKDAIDFFVDSKREKFDETIEISMNLGIDPRHADQMVRGVVSLPNGNGKNMKVSFAISVVAIFGLIGFIITFPMWWESFKPMFVQVLPLSEDFKIPIPAYDDLEELFSPVPTTINLVFQSTSKSPIFWVSELSIMGLNVLPLLTVCQSPPDAYAT